MICSTCEAPVAVDSLKIWNGRTVCVDCFGVLSGQATPSQPNPENPRTIRETTVCPSCQAEFHKDHPICPECNTVLDPAYRIARQVHRVAKDVTDNVDEKTWVTRQYVNYFVRGVIGGLMWIWVAVAVIDLCRDFSDLLDGTGTPNLIGMCISLVAMPWLAKRIWPGRFQIKTRVKKEDVWKPAADSSLVVETEPIQHSPPKVDLESLNVEEKPAFPIVEKKQEYPKPVPKTSNPLLVSGLLCVIFFAPLLSCIIFSGPVPYKVAPKIKHISASRQELPAVKDVQEETVVLADYRDLVSSSTSRVSSETTVSPEQQLEPRKAVQDASASTVRDVPVKDTLVGAPPSDDKVHPTIVREEALSSKPTTDKLDNLDASLALTSFGVGNLEWMVPLTHFRMKYPHSLFEGERSSTGTTSYVVTGSYNGRPARVHYAFDLDQKLLQLVLVIFTGKSDEKDFAATETFLSNRIERMRRSSSDKFKLHTEGQHYATAVDHMLMDPIDAGPEFTIEQVMLRKRKGDAPAYDSSNIPPLNLEISGSGWRHYAWGLSTTRFRNLHPNAAKRVTNGVVSRGVKMVVAGRNAAVNFGFVDDQLALISIAYLANIDEKIFNRHRKLLDRKYGGFTQSFSPNLKLLAQYNGHVDPTRITHLCFSFDGKIGEGITLSDRRIIK